MPPGALPDARPCGPRSRHRLLPDGSGLTMAGHRPCSTTAARSWSFPCRVRAPAASSHRRTPCPSTAPCRAPTHTAASATSTLAPPRNSASNEVQMRQNVGLAVVNERRELRPLLPRLIGHVTQRLARLRAIRLDERLTQRGRHHALLCLCHVRQRVSHPMYATALPCGREDATNRRLQPLMGVRDHQLHPAQATPRQVLQAARPDVSATEGPMCSPTISRLPSVFTATAIIAATETIRPPSRCLR